MDFKELVVLRVSSVLEHVSYLKDDVVVTIEQVSGK
jgi:hypothetical protein